MHATVGTYGYRGRWVAVLLVASGRMTFVVEERTRYPGDHEGRSRLVGRFGDERRAELAAEARVLASGGQLGEVAETLAGSPVSGQAAVELCPAAYEFPAAAERERRDGRPVTAVLCRQLLSGRSGRFVHVRAPAAPRR